MSRKSADGWARGAPRARPCARLVTEGAPLTLNLTELRDSSAVGPEAWLARAEADGYLFFRDLVARDAVRALRDLTLAVADDLGWLDRSAPRSAGVAVAGIALGAYDDPRWVELLTRVMSQPAFFSLRDDAALARVLRVLFAGPPKPAVGDLVRVVSGDDERHTTLAHQDRAYVLGEGALWTAWLPLGECPKSLGPLAILPGSHRQGLLPHAGDADWRKGVSVPADAEWAASDLLAGDVLFFSGLTVHRALPHRGGRRLRLSADFRFVRAD